MRLLLESYINQSHSIEQSSMHPSKSTLNKILQLTTRLQEAFRSINEDLRQLIALNSDVGKMQTEKSYLCKLQEPVETRKCEEKQKRKPRNQSKVYTVESSTSGQFNQLEPTWTEEQKKVQKLNNPEQDDETSLNKKAALSPYFLFYVELRQRLQKQHPQISLQLCGKIIVDTWQRYGQQEKQPYYDKWEQKTAKSKTKKKKQLFRQSFASGKEKEGKSMII